MHKQQPENAVPQRGHQAGRVRGEAALEAAGRAGGAWHAPVALSFGSSVPPGGDAAKLAQVGGGRMARAGGALRQLQESYGNRYVQQVVRSAQAPSTGAPVIQAKLVLGAAGDKYEREADRVAEEVTGQDRGPAQEPVQETVQETGSHIGLGGERRLLRKQGDQPQHGAAGGAVAPHVQQAIKGARGGGQPLAGRVRAQMEGALRTDFGQVRVHTGPQADQLNRALRARAFTTGQDIFFRRGAYAPATDEGRKLIAHELAHVMQQGAPTSSTTPSSSGDVIRRKPMVYDPSTGNEVDAADWDIDQIEAWLAWYEKAMSYDRTRYSADNNALLDLKNSDAIQDKVRQRNDPEGYTFDQKKKTAGRDAQRIKAANDAIDAFEKLNHANSFLDYDPAVVEKELREVVADPGKMDQKGYPLCGADTYLRLFAVHHPDAYVAFVVALLTTGTGTLGAQTVTAPKSVREKNLWSQKMRISEWVASASLRIQSNTAGYDTVHQARGTVNPIPYFKHWNAQLAGMTSLSEVKAWLRAADPNLPVTMRSYRVTPTPRAIIADLNAAFGAGEAIALMINGDIVDNAYGKKVGSHIGAHLVTLASDIHQTSDGTNYIGEVLTWGAKKRIVFRYDELSKAIFGYVAADLAQFNPGGGQGGADDGQQ